MGIQRNYFFETFPEILVLNCPLDYFFCVNFAKKLLPRRSSCIYGGEVVDSYQISLSDSEKNDLPKPNYTQKNYMYLDISSEQAVVVLDILFTVSVCLSPILPIPNFLKI